MSEEVSAYVDPRYNLKDPMEEDRKQLRRLREATRYPILRNVCTGIAVFQTVVGIFLTVLVFVGGPGALLAGLGCLVGVVPWMFGLVILDIADSMQNAAKKGD